MYYLGNDIVDFSTKETQKKFQDTRFLNRIYSLPEQRAILSAKNPDATLWALWAIKEAAYKACVKHTGAIYFSSDLFEVRESDLVALSQHQTFFPAYSGQVKWKEWIGKFTLVAVANNVIHVIVLIGAKPATANLATVARLQYLEQDASYQEQSQAVRSLINEWVRAEGLAEDTRVIRPILKGKKRLGAPRLYSTTEDLTSYQISLSHDGHWVGFAAMRMKVR